MIERFRDHAANERTFLAWVRTAIAIMAFGFLAEKFDLFLDIAGKRLGDRAASIGGHDVGGIAGLLLILLGGAILVVATIRFRKTSRAISSPDTMRNIGERLDFVLVGLLGLLGSALFVYLVYAVGSRI